MSHHYANDGQFNFSWSEGEFLIRVRRSTQDGASECRRERRKDVVAEREGEVESERERKP